MSMIDRNCPDLSVRQQVELLDVPRSTLYYQSVADLEEDHNLMRRIDEIYTQQPFYGYRKITDTLRNEDGLIINHKKVRRLMQEMGLVAIYPKPKTSVANAEHQVYPYRLRGVNITHPNHVWATDITYIRMQQGFVYLVAVIDWYSRYILSWQLSNTMEAEFCLEALNQALKIATPSIFNTDQGAQFTSQAFTGILKNHNINISMNGKGRCVDNMIIERFWRSLKYEDVYIKDYDTVKIARDNIAAYIHFYNHTRPHQALQYVTPAKCYNKIIQGEL